MKRKTFVLMIFLMGYFNQAHGVRFSPDVHGLRSLNFGVLVNNSEYQIYRSQRLGKIPLRVLKRHLKKEKVLFPKTIIYMNKYGYKKYIPFWNPFVLEEDRLQSKYSYRLYHSFDARNRTYLDGYNPYRPEHDIDEKNYLGKRAKKKYGVIVDGELDGDDDDFLYIMSLVLDKEKQPVLFHCFGGKHRTGMVGLAIRYIQGGNWVNGIKRSQEIKGKNYELNPAQYEYYLHNKKKFRAENLQFIEDMYYHDERFQTLIKQYRKQLNKT